MNKETEDLTKGKHEAVDHYEEAREHAQKALKQKALKKAVDDD